MRQYTFYQLNIYPAESDGEGEDHDEWFTSLEAAKRRRRELINASLQDNQVDEDFQIDKVITAPMTPKALVLGVLNRRNWVASYEMVVPPHTFERAESEDSE